MTTQETPLDRWRTASDSLPWVKGHLDESTFTCFKVAVAEGIARQDAFSLAENRIRSSSGQRQTTHFFDPEVFSHANQETD
jgi:hypothetical protein